MDLNTGVILTLLFIFQIFSLYLFSKLLIQSLSKLFFRLTMSHTRTVHFIAIIFLPGTCIHEFAHALTATLCLVKVEDIHLLPEIEDSTVKLGSVEMRRSDPFRRALIGFAPILWGVTILLVLTYLIENKIPHELPLWWAYLILGYLIFVISNTMFSSRKDVEGMILVIVLLIALVIALLLFKIYAPFLWLTQLLNNNTQFLMNLNLYLLVPILVDIFVYSLFKLFKLNR